MTEPTLLHPPETSAGPLTATVVAGLRWSYASTVVVTVLQIAVTAVLARLLSPAAFGLVAMAGLILRIGQYFAEMGAGQAVVQRPSLTERDMRTAFTSATLMGIVFTLIFATLAPLAAYLFPDSEGVVPVTRAMSLMFLAGGLTATTQGLLRRRFAFRAIALTEISTYFVGYAMLGLVLAFTGFGVWSLVAASLGQAALAAAVYVVLCRGQIGLAFSYSSFKTIYSYGGRISVIGFTEVIATTLDTLWAGHFLGTRLTGLYSRARNLAIVPLYQFTTSLTRVLLPAYSRIQGERDRLLKTYLAGVLVVATIAMPVAWGIAGASREVILTLLGDQWLEAVPLLAVMSFAVPFMLVGHLAALLCDAVAALRVRMIITVARLVWLAVLLIILGRYGIVGVAVAFATSEVLTHLSYQMVMHRLLGATAVQLWLAHAVGVGAGAVTALVLYGLNVALVAAGLPPILILAVQLLAGMVILLVAVSRARGGLVWAEVRWRLDVAGLGLDTGFTGLVVRTLDRLAPARPSPVELDEG